MSKPEIESIHPLSPLQEGMLFHTLLGEEANPYVGQLSFSLRGVDAAAMRGAWQTVVQRHAALRTAFVHRRRDRALQVAQRRVELPFVEEDWRGTEGEALAERLRERRRAERERGFDLGKAPLMRLLLARTGDDRHELVWTFHHLVTDGWSTGVILDEAFGLHAALRRGETPRLAPARPFAEYLTWLARRDGAGAEAFWRGALGDVEAPTPLGIGRRADAAGDHAEATARVGGDAGRALLRLGRERQITASTLVQGAWALLLSRYAGQDDVVFGGTVSGRPPELAGVERMVGMFINTIPVRAVVRPRMPAAEWLREFQARQAEAREWEHTPLVQAQGCSGVPRGTPLFETLVVFENTGGAGASRNEAPAAERAAAPGALQVAGMRAVERTSYPLTLVAGAGGDEIGLKLLYDTARIDAATAGRALGHLSSLLRAIAADPDRAMGELAWMADEDAAVLRDAWNGTAAAVPDAPVHHLFQAQAAATPHAAAVEWGGESLTYAALNARANRLARHLAARGAGPESRVGVSMERGVDLVVSLLAILKTGGAYVPLDPSYPAERLAYMADDAGVSVLVVRRGVPEALDGFGGAVVSLQGDAAAIAGMDDADVESARAGADALAYVVYTSGSTGQPKGIGIPHRGIVRLVRNADFAQLNAADRVAQISNASFDAITWELWGALLNGAALVGVDRDTVLAPGLLAGALAERRVTAAFITTALFNQVAHAAPGGFGGLTHLCFGGEACDPAAIRAVLAAGGPRRLLHVYGPTESTTFATWHRVNGVPAGAATVPIGQPISNTTAYVVDRAMRLCPPGVPGELLLGGEGLARGYLGRAALTAEKFVPSPFCARGGARLYRTGDLVRRGDDGAIEFLGRIDGQVKLRGFRIELGEVESALLAQPGVREAVAVIREDAPGDRRMVAYVAGASISPIALKDALRRGLPEYMVPSAVVVLEGLPLNANGKVDRRALPAPVVAGEEDGFEAPSTPVEEVIAQIWAEVLGAARVGAADSFFELGGHSLLATRVASRIREALGVEVPLRVLFTTPVLRDLARWAADARLAGVAPPPPVVAGARPARVPLTFAQERLWYLDQLEPGSTLFNVPGAVRLGGELNVQALERALSEIVRRHEALRTVIHADDGQPWQVVLPAAPVSLRVADLSALADDERERAVRAGVAEEAALPFSLAEGPLFRARLLRLAEQEHVLLITMHHAVTDGWSMGVFRRELGALYAAFAAGQPSPLAEPALQYADYAVWQREHVAGELLERQMAFWREAMAGAPALLELAADRPRPTVQSHRGARAAVAVPAPVAERLRALSRGEGASLFMTLLAAFNVLLSRWSGQTDVVVGTSIAGRTRGETEGLMGLFFNTLALRTDLSGDPAFKALIGRVREATLGAYDNQDVPFERLVEALAPQRTLSYTPIYQVLFELHNAPRGGAGALAGLRQQAVSADVSTAKHDISLMLSEGGGGIGGTLEYSTDLFDAATIQRLVDSYLVLLEAVAADATRPISRLPVLTAGERDEMLHAWNPSPSPFPSQTTVHALFERQVDRTPDATALTWVDGSMTYREMDERANRLANHLREMGIGAESRVGILTHRTPEMMIGIMAIMKAGGAYVPLDHTHPADRIAYTLDDSGATVLLTEGGFSDKVVNFAGSVVLVDADAETIASRSAARAGGGVSADNLAYIYYTSGSTGRPKGVLMHHRGVCNYIHWGCDYYGAASGNGSPVFSSIAVDLTVTNFLPLFVGKPVHLVPEGPGVDALADLLKTRPGFSHIKITPTHLSLLNPLLSAEEARACANTLVIGADNLRAEPTLFWQENAPNVRLLNEYGPTETVVGCAIYDVSAGAPRSGPVSIGRTIDNITWYVLDERMEPTPAGVPGELFIGGVGVARGYGNRPAMTAEKFIPNPFSSVPGDRLYRTGDRARWLAGGQMEFLGRTDFQVKIRGYRVETGEVESVLMADPRISKALAVIREDVPGDHRLVGYVVPVQGRAAPSVGEMRALLKQKLPEYMVPSAFVTLSEDQVPTSGKISPRQLPAPSADRAHDDALVPPRDHVDMQLVQIWEETLGVHPVGIEDGFFELGGNSLLAVRLLSRVRQRFGSAVPLATLVGGATIRAIADGLRAAPTVTEAASPLVALQPRGSLPPLFCVHAAGGGLVGYVTMTRQLGPDQPVYGLQDPLYPVGGVTSAPVEELAATYLRAVRGVQPQGPYRLLGWSFGGTVAFEMARQLRAAGERVALLAVLDTMAPLWTDLFPDGDDTDTRVLAGLLRETGLQRGVRLDVTSTQLAAHPGEARYAYALRLLEEHGLARPGVGVQAIRGMMSMWWTRTRQSRDYQPGAYDGEVTLFRATEIDTEVGVDFPEVLRLNLEEPVLGWERLAARVAVHRVPGAHATLGIEPNVRVLSARLRECLAAAAEPADELVPA